MTSSALERSLAPVVPDDDEVTAVVVAFSSSTAEHGVVDRWFGELRRTHPRAEIVHLQHAAARQPAAAELLPLRHDRRDVLVVPVRVAWRPPERDGGRAAAFSDMLRLTNPYRPRPRQQRRLMERAPDRYQLVVAEPATLAQLVARFTKQNPDLGEDASAFRAVRLAPIGAGARAGGVAPLRRALQAPPIGARGDLGEHSIPRWHRRPRPPARSVGGDDYGGGVRLPRGDGRHSKPGHRRCRRPFCEAVQPPDLRRQPPLRPKRAGDAP